MYEREENESEVYVHIRPVDAEIYTKYVCPHCNIKYMLLESAEDTHPRACEIVRQNKGKIMYCKNRDSLIIPRRTGGPGYQMVFAEELSGFSRDLRSRSTNHCVERFVHAEEATKKQIDDVFTRYQSSWIYMMERIGYRRNCK